MTPNHVKAKNYSLAVGRVYRILDRPSVISCLPCRSRILLRRLPSTHLQRSITTPFSASSSIWITTGTATATSPHPAGSRRPTALNPLSMSEIHPCHHVTIHTWISNRSRTGVQEWDTDMGRPCTPKACRISHCRLEDPFSRISIPRAVMGKRRRSRAVRVLSFRPGSRALRRGYWSVGERADRGDPSLVDRRRRNVGEQERDGAVG